MTLITSILERVARQCSVEQPSSWLTATDTEHVELRDDFLPEAVHNILTRLDLPGPIGKQTVITGTGAEDYDLPSDFLRMQRDQMAVYETTTTRRALQPVSNDGEWAHLKEIGSTGYMRYYRVQGYPGNYTIGIYKEPTATQSVTVSYISTAWKASAEGVTGDEFTSETDVAILPRELLETGTVYRFRRRKGLDYMDVRTEYEALLRHHSNDSRSRRQINMGSGPTGRKPWDIPVPDFIPSGS